MGRLGLGQEDWFQTCVIYDLMATEFISLVVMATMDADDRWSHGDRIHRFGCCGNDGGRGRMISWRRNSSAWSLWQRRRQMTDDLMATEFISLDVMATRAADDRWPHGDGIHQLGRYGNEGGRWKMISWRWNSLACLSWQLCLVHTKQKRVFLTAELTSVCRRQWRARSPTLMILQNWSLD